RRTDRPRREEIEVAGDCILVGVIYGIRSGGRRIGRVGVRHSFDGQEWVRLSGYARKRKPSLLALRPQGFQNAIVDDQARSDGIQFWSLSSEIGNLRRNLITVGALCIDVAEIELPEVASVVPLQEELESDGPI